MYKAADLIESRKEDIAQCMTREMGKIAFQQSL
nr:aldehyde dehydrogenase family protein [Salibacterium qingdaonense]